MEPNYKPSIVAVTWDGVSPALSHIFQDVPPQFEILLFDNTGRADKALFAHLPITHYISHKTECKGDIIEHIYYYFQNNNNHPPANYKYIGIIDDDVYFSVSDLNKLLFLANLEELDVFQASLTHDGSNSHRELIHKAGVIIQETLWVEIMAPFYDMEIFMAAGPYYQHSISGQGIDVYLIPTLQRILKKNKTAVVHAVQMKHCRPIRTDFRRFVNGKDNLTEINDIKNICYLLASEHKELFDQAFYKNVLDIEYTRKIPFLRKVKRIKPMLKNLYSLIVDASYR
jgi:hypothetical protein